VNRRKWLLILLAVAAVGCGGGGPTSPDPADVIIPSPLTANQQLAVDIVECHLKYWGKTYQITIRFEDARRSDGAHAWADTMGRIIHVAKPSLESWAPVDIEMVMGHELAHILGADGEDQATEWASQAYHNAECH
jgi:hypothetical protein